MKPRLLAPGLAMHFRSPVRFGTALRGYEAPLRTLQLMMLFWGGVIGAKALAHFVTQGAWLLAGLLSSA
jgi:hypothetical protein